MKEKTKEIILSVLIYLLFLVSFYWLTLFASLGQIILENRTGEWNALFRWGANLITKFLF